MVHEVIANRLFVVQSRHNDLVLCSAVITREDEPARRHLPWHVSIGNRVSEFATLDEAIENAKCRVSA